MTAQDFDLDLPPFSLEAGAALPRHTVRGMWFDDARGPADRPVVLVIPALTGDARAGGGGGFWEPLIGPGRALDTRRYRVLSMSLLGSCTGSTGPADADFPRASADTVSAVTQPPQSSKGSFVLPLEQLPATVTTWDQARSLAMALDRLEVETVHTVIGGSLGGMVALALAAWIPERVQQVLALGASAQASGWLLSWNHVARRLLANALQAGEDPREALSLARQLAMISYRSPAGIDAAQGRTQVQKSAWNARVPYRIETWLENQGTRLAERFDARAYYCLLGAMNHHDLLRRAPESGHTLASIKARTWAVALEHDTLFREHESEWVVQRLTELGVPAHYDMVRSVYGHDALFLAWGELQRVLRHVLVDGAA